ncbi:metal ABC transporter solute-binding protein, Zn/Mn family [Allofustis seminis]|uniref:metal ABC transporter solute-binding protein, Zn/Mn family n=1 Tax=Allofustis seminis TaxID=166939 RepID=UPI00035CCA67
MKKFIKTLFSAFFVFMLMACGNGKSDKKVEDKGASGDKPTVTTTTSFLYDMTKQLAGDKVTVELIIPAGEDPHLYEAKPEDLEKLSSADLVLYHGLHFEGKMVDALEATGVAVAKNFTKEEIGEMDEGGQMVVDPHFWFDIDLYKKAVDVAADELAKLTKDDSIREKAEEYKGELDKLDEYNRTELDKISAESRYLITPHDAFNYFSRHYGMEVVAPQGVSTDSEVSNTNIQETVDFIIEHKVKAIFAESTTDPARMEKIQEACKKQGFDVTVVQGEGEELFSDSLAQEGKDGDNYIDMYKHNVDLMVKYLK